MILLYTEEQLHTAYKVYVQDYVTYTGPVIPTLEEFRILFEKDERIQALAEQDVSEH